MRTPRIEIDLTKIAHNAKSLKKLYDTKGISIIGVIKGVSSDLKIAETLVNSGIEMLGDSSIDNIQRMRDAGINARFVLLRTPALSETKLVIESADISLNTEIEVIRHLSDEAKKQDKMHEIILMIEMGDLREGIMPEDILTFIEKVIDIPNINIVGIGANFACMSRAPSIFEEMQQMTSIAYQIEQSFPIKLTYISGGNSANHFWLMNTSNQGRINNLRIGEVLLLGNDSVRKETIPGLYTDAFKLITEVIELKEKPKVLNTKGAQKRVQAVLNIGNHDTCITGLSPTIDIDMIGSSSNHLVVDAKKTGLNVGDKVTFILSYHAVLTSIISPTVFTCYSE